MPHVGESDGPFGEEIQPLVLVVVARTNGMAMAICELKLIFEIVSGVLAFIAAGFWFYASWIGRNSFL